MEQKNEMLRVTIFTSKHKINGKIHLYENSRLSDILNTENLSKDFLPIIDADITDLDTGKIEQSNFISINKNHIELVMEEQEEK
ncbi:MAG: hypothetical protein ACQETH_09020 [Candidatus Rifleibacteriota bacterium]